MTDAASPDQTQAPVAQDECPFQRLNPLSIILKSVSTLTRNIIAIAVLHFSIFDQNWAYTAPAAAAIVALVLAVNGVIWSRFSYQIAAKEIRIKSGLLNRNNRSIPFDRIQDVSLEQKLLHRLLGLAIVKLETGSGGGDDGKLDALARDDGRALRDHIRDYKAGLQASDVISELSEEEAKPPLFAMDNRRIFIAGLFNFSFVLLAIVGAIAQNLDAIMDVPYFEVSYWMARLTTDTEFVDGLSLTARIFGLAGAIFSLILVGVVSGLVRTFVREYRFRLDRVDSGQAGFRRRRGLFTLTDVVMPIHRVQAAILQTGPVRERYGWHHLKFQSLAGDTGEETDHSVAPCAQSDEIAPILTEANIQNANSEQIFHPVHPAYWWRDAIIAAVILSAISLGNGFVVHPGLYALTLLILPITALLFLRWKHHRYALSETQLFVRSGWWRRRLIILPRRKLQTIDVAQSPLDHPLDLATVTVGVAGGSSIRPLAIKDIRFELAMALRTALIEDQKDA